jgi:molecular chaperone GrpE
VKKLGIDPQFLVDQAEEIYKKYSNEIKNEVNQKKQEIVEEVQEPEEKEWDEEFDENEEPSAIDSLLENSETLLEQVSALNKKFDQKIKTDMHKAEMFDNMHKELTQYKNGLITQVINNILIDIIQIIDINDKNISLFKNQDCSEENYEKIIKILKGVSEDLTDVLYRQSVEPYTLDEIDVKRQKILQVIPTNDISLDRTIAKKIVPGYEKDGKIIRPERISIYKYKESEENPNE